MAPDVSSSGTAVLSHQYGQTSGDLDYTEASTQGAGSVDSSLGSFVSSKPVKEAPFGDFVRTKSSLVNGNGSDTLYSSQHQNGQGEDLWSSVLNSVKSSRAIPVKNVIMLGEARTGKTTLVSHLASLSPSGFSQQSKREDVADPGVDSADLGLGYSYFDVGDEDGEDVVARVGVYQISSSDSAYLSLLPLALSNPVDARAASSQYTGHTQASGSRQSKTSIDAESNSKRIDTKPKPSIEALRNSLFLITLDWETPWTFLSQLVEWLDVIRAIVEEAANATKGSFSRETVVWEEMKESLEASIRAYSDNTAAAGIGLIADSEDEVGESSVASAIIPVANPTAVDGDERIPLPEGCLTHNLGIPLVVVCTKADTISQLERERNFKEEKFDYVQQVLRTICLKYGAGLFFTSQTKPATFDVLRSYLLHHLFSPSSQGMAMGAFAFTHRASTVERDLLLVPAGWDSFGKIRALRDTFDCAGMANGWEWDAQVERVRRNQGLPKGSREAEEAAEQQIDRRSLPGLVEGDRSGVESTIKLYEAIVEDWDANTAPLAVNSNKVKEPDDQEFLLQHYTALQREPEAKARLSRQGSASAVPAQRTEANRSVVGPVGSSSLSLPSVERAILERQQSDDGKSMKATVSSRREGHSSRDRERERDRDRESGKSTPMRTAAGLQSHSVASSDKIGEVRPTSPLNSATQTPKQSEVLHSFFQSLLKEKAPGSGMSGASRSNASRGTATGERKSGGQ